MIIGGVAVIARGVPRLTRDVDGTVAGEGTDLDALLATLARHHITSRLEGAVDVAWRPQEQQDIERLIALHGDRMDLVRVRSFAREVAAMLDDPDRVEEMEQLIRRNHRER